MVTVESVIRKEAKKRGVTLTADEKAALAQTEATTGAKKGSSGKLFAFLKLAGAGAILAGVWWWFKKKAGVGAGAADAAIAAPDMAITP